MSTIHPRLNVVIEPNLYHAVEKIAKRNGASLSMTARDLIKEALEIEEDIHWEKAASAREASFDKKKGLSHEHIW